jgi:peptide/nickel transport system permease protein
MPVFLALLIGGFLGVAAGYAGGLVNSAIMRLTDILYAFPSILLAIAITGILGSGLQNTILALTISFIPPVIRISESVTTQVRHLDFVEAALAAGLSFLGLGVTPPSAEWGLMLNNLRQALWVSPLVAALPGVMIFITSMCFNLMSDGLRQAMDVRL